MCDIRNLKVRRERENRNPSSPWWCLLNCCSIFPPYCPDNMAAALELRCGWLCWADSVVHEGNLWVCSCPGLWWIIYLFMNLMCVGFFFLQCGLHWSVAYINETCKSRAEQSRVSVQSCTLYIPYTENGIVEFAIFLIKWSNWMFIRTYKAHKCRFELALLLQSICSTNLQEPQASVCKPLVVLSSSRKFSTEPFPVGV